MPFPPSHPGLLQALSERGYAEPTPVQANVLEPETRARDLLVLGQLKVVVLDEADEMLDLGFREDLERMLDTAPDERRTLLFSATIPKEIAGFAKRYQKDALRIASSSEQEPHGDIEYRAVEI